MNVLVQRIAAVSTAVSTGGEMFLDGSTMHECFTLEPPQRTDGAKPRAIPAGTYDLTIRFSPHFGHLMPHVENVPGFAGILIHPGNTAVNTEGCTLVGTTQGPDFVGHSQAEFAPLFLKMLNASTLTGGVAGENSAVYRVGRITYADPVVADGEVS